MKPPIVRHSLGDYILGEFVPTDDPHGQIISRCPGNLELESVEFAFSYQHIPEATRAARKAFRTWSRLPIDKRSSALKAYRDLLEKSIPSLAQDMSFESGRPLWESVEECQETVRLLDYYLKTLPQEVLPVQVEDLPAQTTGKIRFLARGVAAIIAPGIRSLVDAHAHFFPTLVVGNSVVFKSSKYAPYLGQRIAELFHESGLPAGVFNVLHGDSEVAHRLVSDLEVDTVFFTGSFETGLKLKRHLSGDYWKHLVLELVGKNSILIWKDCDYKQALHDSLLSAYLSTGQRRTSAHRLLVHESLFDRFISDFHQLAKKCTVGFNPTPSASATEPFLGPLLNENALENYIRSQGIATREGAEEIMRGKTLERKEKGYYVSPSIHWVKQLDTKSVYQKSEIFGPNVAVYRISELDEAIEILNSSQHGLISSIYSQSREVLGPVMDEVKTGLFLWNLPTVHPAKEVPHIGLKKSGNSQPTGSWAWKQGTYPVSSLEYSGKEGSVPHPAALPKLG